LKKLMILAAMLAVAMIAVAPALGQDDPAVVADAKAKEAKAGGAFAEAECKDGYIESKAGGVVAKAPCETPPPPPPAKAAPAPPPPAPAPPPPTVAPAPASAPAPAPKEEKKALPPSGGSSMASLFALGAGALLVGGGLLVRRFIR
jgi:hypothetical protein